MWKVEPNKANTTRCLRLLGADFEFFASSCSSSTFLGSAEQRKDALHVKINVSPCRVPVVSMCDLGRAVAGARILCFLKHPH